MCRLTGLAGATRADCRRTVVVAFLFASAAAGHSETWEPPPGIPAPPFGITESVDMYLSPDYNYNYADDDANHAVPYRVANGKPYTFYIDTAHPEATDEANPHGSPMRPRRTWPYPLRAGDCVQVHGGPYRFTNAPKACMVFGGSGTASLPIFLYGTGESPETWPTLGPNVLYIFGDFAIIERVKLVENAILNTRPLLKGAPVISPVVRNCLFEGIQKKGNPTCVGTGGSRGTSDTAYTQDIVVWQNVMRNYGDVTAPQENDACGVILSQHCINGWVVDNEISGMGGDGIRLGADQGDIPSGRNYYVARNHIHDNRENGIDIKQAINAVVAYNDFHGFRRCSSSAGEAVAIHYRPQNIWILANTIHESDRGIVSTGIGTDLYIVGNAIRDIATYAIYPDRGGGRIHIFGNTIAHSGSGIVCSGVVESLTIRGNILYDIAGDYLEVTDSAVRSRSSLSHETYFSPNGRVSIQWGSSYASLPSLRRATSVADHSSTEDPMLVAPASGDFSLAPHSPARDSGFDWSALDIAYRESFGVSMLWDLHGRRRPAGKGMDKGAVESP